jgi:hypothetical protein
MERMDAILHFDLPLHKRVIDALDLRNRPNSSGILPLYDRIWSYTILLKEWRLFSGTSCLRLDTAESVELRIAVHDAYRLSILLLRPIGQLLVSRHLLHSKIWSSEQPQYQFRHEESPSFSYDFDSFYYDTRHPGVCNFYLEIHLRDLLEHKGVAVPHVSRHVYCLCWNDRGHPFSPYLAAEIWSRGPEDGR